MTTIEIQVPPINQYTLYAMLTLLGKYETKVKAFL